MHPLIVSKRGEIATVCSRHHVQRLELFGSANDGTKFNIDSSHVDFLVEFAPLPAGGYFDHCFGLQEDLGALLGRPVDMVVERAIRNPYFR